MIYTTLHRAVPPEPIGCVLHAQLAAVVPFSSTFAPRHVVPIGQSPSTAHALHTPICTIPSPATSVTAHLPDVHTEPSPSPLGSNGQSAPSARLPGGTHCKLPSEIAIPPYTITGTHVSPAMQSAEVAHSLQK